MGNGEAEGRSTSDDMDVRATACPLRTSPSAAALLPLSCVADTTDPMLDSGRDQTASNGIPASRKRSHCASVVSDFVSKLFSAISGAHFKDQIRWSELGDSFIVVDQCAFARDVMPVMFSHTNYQSFVRQLNKYGFHKLKTGDAKMGSTGAMTAEFQHVSFLRDHPELLGEITRKKNVVRKLEPEVATGVGLALYSANTSASPHISDTQIQRTSPISLTTWESVSLVSNSSNIPGTQNSFVNVMESRFNQLAEMQASANINYSRASQECEAFRRELNYLKNAVVRQDLLMEHFTNIVSATMKRESKLQLLKEFQNALRREMPPHLASSTPATLHSQPSSSHLPTPFVSASPNSFDFSHPHFAPKPPLSFVKSGLLLSPNFTNSLTPFDASDFKTTVTPRRAPPTQQPHEHHYNYDSSISFNMCLPQSGPLPPRPNETVLTQIAVNTNLARSDSANSLHESHQRVKQSYRAFIISDDLPTRHALRLELNALNVSCEIIADQQSLRNICSRQMALSNQSCVLFLDHDSCTFNIPATAKAIREMNPTVNLMLMAARPNDVDFRFYKSVGLIECLGKPVSSLGLRHVFEKAQIWL
ncbi:HSF-type DNA-binding-domain-containing protein [Chytriomyces cf. hyalinus JEL632]|nr:HSF-type DNA-binding-domain-containing protein [Chytriomyces cf. hyalinus JEL632]